MINFSRVFLLIILLFTFVLFILPSISVSVFLCLTNIYFHICQSHMQERVVCKLIIIKFQYQISDFYLEKLIKIFNI